MGFGRDTQTPATSRSRSTPQRPSRPYFEYLAPSSTRVWSRSAHSQKTLVQSLSHVGLEKCFVHSPRYCSPALVGCQSWVHVSRAVWSGGHFSHSGAPETSHLAASTA